MSTTEILEDFFFIERGYLSGNHFVYRCEAPVLIDTGYRSDFEATERLITGLGVNLADVSLIVNTHTHCDHIGGNHLIQERSGCDIALHAVGKHFVDSRDDWSTWWRYFNQEADFFRCTRSLDDGDEVALGPHRFQVIYTPGHAADGIVLYNRSEKVLISSDTLWENDIAAMTLRVEGSSALFRMRDSLKRLTRLDVETCYPGHGPPFDHFGLALSKSLDKIERYLADGTLVGRDLLKKIIVYTLLMRQPMHADDLFPYLMGTYWYRETVDLYFGGAYETTCRDILGEFLDRGIIRNDNNRLSATVKP